MAEQTDQIRITRVASGNLDVDPSYRFVTQAAGGNKDVFLSATTGSIITGVVQNKPQDNEHATLCVLGDTKIALASSLGAGIYVMAGASGFAVEAQSGQVVGGLLLTSGTSGAVAEMALNPWRAAADPNP